MSSRSFSLARSGCVLRRCANVSSEVEKEFIRTKRTLAPNDFRWCLTCSAMMSRNVLPSLTTRRDLAFSRPMDVPRPPLSLSMAVWERRSRTRASSRGPRRDSSVGREATGLISASGNSPVLPDMSWS